MEWVFVRGISKDQLVQRLTQGFGRAGVTVICLDYCVVGNVLWSVWEISGLTEVPFRYIECDHLMEHHADGWGYRQSYEEDGPCVWSCPLSYFELVPVVTNQVWRDLVELSYEASRYRAAA